jgi:2-iminobutanoate/2-iminopropanoate deaminase
MNFKIKYAYGVLFMALVPLTAQPLIERVESANAPAAIGPYSQAVRVNNAQLLYISGQIPVSSLSGEMITEIKAATAQVMEYLRLILLQGGMDFSNVIKATIFLTNMQDFASMNEVYGSYFKNVDIKPARETVEVRALPKNAIVEISMIAAKGQ